MIKTFLVLALLGTPVAAQHAHTTSHSMGNETVLTEPGQGAFAALAEVVSTLENDPETKWASIDIDGLRTHLVDMDLLATQATIKVERLSDGLQAKATGDARTVAALRRMIPAHAAQLGTDDKWDARGEVSADGATLIVSSNDPEVVARIHGLGFFGLMASQDHHRAHHLAIAKGEPPHGH